jgi:hypothetical protein
MNLAYLTNPFDTDTEAGNPRSCASADPLFPQGLVAPGFSVHSAPAQVHMGWRAYRALFIWFWEPFAAFIFKVRKRKT